MNRLVQYIVAVGLLFILMGTPARAASSTLLIAQVQAGAASTETAAPTQEFVSIYNNSAQDVDITGWCVTNKSGNNLACIVPSTIGQQLFLPSHHYMIIASDSFVTYHPGILADAIIATTNTTSGSFVGSGDTVSLKDSAGTIIDSMSWTSSLSGGTILQRGAAANPGTLIDTDTGADFTKIQGATLPSSGVYEVVTVVDQCTNLDDIQVTISLGYVQNIDGACYQDACINVDGLQITVPEEHVQTSDRVCTFDYALLKITELLPNAAGSDIGHEFIEIYNPTDRVVALVNYQLKVGTKLYDFPSDSLAPGEYKVFYNDQITFTLTNTSVEVVLLGDDGSIIDQPLAYDAPDEATTWALIDETWQYTNQATPAAKNRMSVVTIEQEVLNDNDNKTLAPCAANQYRNPETNRCRLLVTLASAVTPCKDGQYRSEETNRCRTIALSGGTLVPCREDQYRSEETNRCRNVVTTASTLTPCKDNQYRSEETNRCRNIAATVMPSAAFAVEPVMETGKAFVGWWALGGVAALAGGYGVWEWRREIALGVGKLGAFFRLRK